VISALAVALGLLAGPLYAQSLADDTLAVPALLDLIVTDARGREVTTLTPADFTVSENGAPLTIRDVRFVRATGSQPLQVPLGAGTEAETRAGGDARVFAFFLDEFHVTPGPAADRARDALMHFVRESLGPSDFVVVMKPLDSLMTIRLTADRQAAAEAMATFLPRRGDYTPRTSFERDFIAGAPARAEISRAQIAVTSLNALTTYLGRLPQARKTLIVLSEGFVEGRRRGEEFVPGLTAVGVTANRHHVAVYPIDLSVPADRTSGPADAAGDVTETRPHERLVALATDTNGLVLSGDHLAADLDRTLREAGGYYVLSVSRGTSQAGKLHPVTVTTKRTGLTVRSRKGYWVPTEDEIRPSAPLTSALAVPAPTTLRKVSTLIRPWFGLTRDSENGTRVSFVWEPAPRIPGDRTPRPQPARVSLSVTTAAGVPLFDGLVLPSSGVMLDGGNDRQLQATFATSPGRLLVQMAIEDAASRVVDRDVRDLVVLPLIGPVSIGTARVYRTRTARDRTLLMNDPEAPPVAARTFARSEQLLVRVPVFARDGTPTLSARLSSGLGGAMRVLEVTEVSGQPALYQIELSLAALPAGAYTVDFIAHGTGGDAKDSLPFRVTP
jgi:VWFA-related protein